jgi:methyl-accepting chemotaxis protein
MVQLVRVAFLAAIAVLGVVGAAAWTGTRTVSRATVQLSEHTLPAVEALAAVHAQMTSIDGDVAKLINPRLSDPARRAEIFARLQADLKALDEASQRYESLPRDPGADALWADLGPKRDAWRQAAEKAADLQRKRDALAAQDAASDDPRVLANESRSMEAFLAMAATHAPAKEAVEKLVDQAHAEAAALRAQAAASVALTGRLLALAFVLGTAALVGIGLLLSRRIDAVSRALVGEAGRACDAARSGRLADRADPAAVSAEFQPVIAGLNATMDAFARPIAATSLYVTRLSNGDVPDRITEPYDGEFDGIKQALNRCIDAVGALVADSNDLVAAAVAGDLGRRADAARHQGDFRKIVEGFNRTLDTVLSPIDESAKVLERLAARDLTARVTGEYPGDHARVKAAINATAGALAGALADVADAVGQVSGAAGQIASSSQAVAAGASQQAASLEQTSASLQSMAESTRRAAESATEASALARSARGAAEGGAEAMAEMAEAMRKIRGAAEGTSQIIRDINEIAFQTNLLALNAAVEAARAGDAGRGFAVVADEVRSLALRSKEAAQKTEALIRESVTQAVAGQERTRTVTERLGHIVSEVGKASGIVAEIADGARAQATGIEQVSTAVAEVDRVTQQNAASSEQGSSSAQELSSQAERLAAMVASFRLAEVSDVQSLRRAVPGRRRDQLPATLTNRGRT